MPFIKQICACACVHPEGDDPVGSHADQRTKKLKDSKPMIVHFWNSIRCQNQKPSQLPGPEKHSRPHLPKTMAIFEAFTATYQKICPCMIFQSTTTIKDKKHHLCGGILSFLLFLLSIFGLNITQIFLNLTVRHVTGMVRIT